MKKGLAFLGPAESVGAMEKEGGDAVPIVFSDVKPRSVVPSAEELRGGQVIQWPVKKDSDEHPEEALASEAKGVLAEAQAAPEGEDAEMSSLDVGIGQVWRCADAAFRVDDIADDEQPIRIIFTEGRLAGEHRTFSVEGFGDFIGDKEFSIVPEEASEESLRQAMAVMEHGEQERSNPLVRPVMKLLGEARVMAEERQDGTMLTYLAENDGLIESLAGKRRLENAEIGLLKDVREKLEGYLGSLAALETEKPAPAETNGKAEQEKQKDPIGEFRDRVGRYAEDIDSKIARASSFSALKGIGAVEEQPIKGSVIALRKFASAEDGELLASIESVKSPSRRDAMKKVLHDADRALRKAWHRKASELGADVKKEKKGERKTRAPRESVPERTVAAEDERSKKKSMKKPKHLDADDAVREAMNNRQDRNPFDVDDAAREFADNQGGKSTPKRRERKATLKESTPEQESGAVYEKLERAVNKEPAYYLIYGSIGVTLKKMPANIREGRVRYEDVIVGAIADNFRHSIDEIGDGFGWSTDEKTVFLNGITKKALRELKLE